MAVSLLATLLLSLPLAQVPGLSIEAEGAEPHCPSIAELASALQAHGIASATAGGVRWTLSYGPDREVATGAPTSRLQLRDPAGRPQLTRTVAMVRSSCADLATLFSAIVERYFIQIGWTGGTSLPTTAARVPAVTSVARVRVGAGPAFLSGNDRNLRATLDVRVRVAGPAVLTLGTFAPGDRATVDLPGGARAERAGWPLRFGVAWARSLGDRVVLEAGADSLWSHETGRTEQAPAPGRAQRLVIDLGGGGLASLRLSPRWHLVADAAGFRAFGPQFTVQLGGASQRVLTIPTWRFLASLRLAFIAWR